MIYLVHFEKPLKHAEHYIGFTDVTLREFPQPVSVDSSMR